MSDFLNTTYERSHKTATT